MYAGARPSAVWLNATAITSRIHQKSFAILAVASATLAVAPLSAQDMATLHGKIRDPLGAVVRGSAVELMDDAAGEAHVVSKTATDASGAYSFRLPKSGRYSVRVTAVSFQPTITAAEYFAGGE